MQAPSPMPYVVGDAGPPAPGLLSREGPVHRESGSSRINQQADFFLILPLAPLRSLLWYKQSPRTLSTSWIVGGSSILPLKRDHGGTRQAHESSLHRCLDRNTRSPSPGSLVSREAVGCMGCTTVRFNTWVDVYRRIHIVSIYPASYEAHKK